MRNLLAFLAAAVIGFLGLGWYLDWYKVSSVPSGTPGHQSYNIELDRTKITEDVEKGLEKGEAKVEGVLNKNRSEASSPSATAKPAEPPASKLQQMGDGTSKVTNQVEEVLLKPGAGGPVVPGVGTKPAN
jgi:hypothetical protein